MMATIPTFTIDMKGRCAECRGEGTAQNGLCLKCTSKAIKGQKMKSAQGAAVAARFDEMKRNVNKQR